MKFRSATTNILLHSILNAKFQRGKKSFEGDGLSWMPAPFSLSSLPLARLVREGDGSLIISDRPTPPLLLPVPVLAAATNGTKEQHSSRGENVILGIQYTYQISVQSATLSSKG